MELQIEDKYKIWIDYMVTQIAIKNHVFWFKLGDTNFDETYKIYPTLGYASKQLFLDLKPRTFDEFCQEKDSSIFCGVIGWNNRFKNRIFSIKN